MTAILGSTGVFGVLFVIFLLILWTLLPFAVFGIKARLDRQVNLLTDIRNELRRINAGEKTESEKSAPEVIQKTEIPTESRQCESQSEISDSELDRHTFSIITKKALIAIVAFIAVPAAFLIAAKDNNKPSLSQVSVSAQPTKSKPPEYPIQQPTVAKFSPPELKNLNTPFFHPIERIHTNIKQLERITGSEFSRGSDNIDKLDFENEEGFMHAEAKDGKINYLSIQLKQTQGCKRLNPIYPGPYLSTVGIDANGLQVRRSNNHVHTFADTKRDVLIQVSCPHNDGRYTIDVASALQKDNANIHLQIIDDEPPPRPIETQSTSLTRDDLKTMTATILNINGLLCAQVNDIRSLKAGDKIFEVTCITYRGGNATKTYIMDAAKVRAWEQ